MPTVEARVIPKPEEGTRTVLVSQGLDGPIIKGNGPTTYICSVCRNVLIEGVYRGQIHNIVFRCPKCQSYNEIQ